MRMNDRQNKVLELIGGRELVKRVAGLPEKKGGQDATLDDALEALQVVGKGELEETVARNARRNAATAQKQHAGEETYQQAFERVVYGQNTTFANEVVDTVLGLNEEHYQEQGIKGRDRDLQDVIDDIFGFSGSRPARQEVEKKEGQKVRSPRPGREAGKRMLREVRDAIANPVQGGTKAIKGGNDSTTLGRMVRDVLDGKETFEKDLGGAVDTPVNSIFYPKTHESTFRPQGPGERASTRMYEAVHGGKASKADEQMKGHDPDKARMPAQAEFKPIHKDKSWDEGGEWPNVRLTKRTIVK